MIIWINGSFGSGKTSLSEQLEKTLVNAHIYDPEEAGFFIRDNIPDPMRKVDFQDFKMWRDFNYTILKNIDESFDGITIVPMTLLDEDYFDEIVGRLRRDDIHVQHYALVASKETLLGRLDKRGDRENPWILDRIDNCIERLNSQTFDKQIRTDDLSIDEIAEYIIEDCGLRRLR